MGAKRKRVPPEPPEEPAGPNDQALQAHKVTAQDEAEPQEQDLAEQLENEILQILRARKPGATC